MGTGPTMYIVGHGPATCESAQGLEANVLVMARDYPETIELYEKLWTQRPGYSCTIDPPLKWLRGAFNVCIPLHVNSGGRVQDVLFRCPLPHKVAESQFPGCMDEKVAAETGTYAWMQDNTPGIPIPQLYGMGFSNGQRFTHIAGRSWLARTMHWIRRFLDHVLGRSTLSQYTLHATETNSFNMPYIILEYISADQGQMLANTWDEHRDDPIRRSNLVRGLSQIMLSLASVPQPVIGSFRFNRDGTVSLDGRPANAAVMILENAGAPRTMPADKTFRSSQAFVSTMLDFHDQRFLAQPNAVFNEADCTLQMTTKAALRLFSDRYIDREYSDGPFPVQFTDLHAGNIFVDADWNIRCLIDLEWMPADVIHVPYWLTGEGVDTIEGEAYDRFNEVRREFMSVWVEAEKQLLGNRGITYSEVMEKSWGSKAVWFWHCLFSVNAMYRVVLSHLCPSLSDDAIRQAVARLWSSDDRDEIVAQKLRDKQQYDLDVKKLFEKAFPGEEKQQEMGDPGEEGQNKGFSEQNNSSSATEPSGLDTARD